MEYYFFKFIFILLNNSATTLPFSPFIFFSITWCEENTDISLCSAYVSYNYVPHEPHFSKLIQIPKFHNSKYYVYSRINKIISYFQGYNYKSHYQVKCNNATYIKKSVLDDVNIVHSNATYDVPYMTLYVYLVGLQQKQK